jgi:hypothetical protein
VPKSFRGEESTGFPEPGAIPEYRIPSVLVQYRGLAIFFGILFIGLTAYFIKWLIAPHPVPPPLPPQSVYIDLVPQKVPAPNP